MPAMRRPQGSAEPRGSGHVGFTEGKYLTLEGKSDMNSIIYLVGLVVVVLFILSLLGLR